MFAVRAGDGRRVRIWAVAIKESWGLVRQTQLLLLLLVGPVLIMAVFGLSLKITGILLTRVAAVVEPGSEGAGEDASRVRILVDDADAELPRILKALDGAEVRSVDLPKASFEEVFFRLVRGPQAMDPDRAVG